MATNPQSYNQILGTHGKLYWNGEEIFEVVSIKVDEKREYEEVYIQGSLVKNGKLKSISYDGTLKIKHVYSRNTKNILAATKAGKDFRGEIFASLADPDAKGAERVSFKDVWFTSFPIFEFEHGKAGEKEYSFNCGGVEFYDYAD